mgnify:CR=1 FL=1
MSDKPNMNIRIEESLKEGLQQQADASDRTLSGQVRFILRQAVKQPATETAEDEV